MQNILIVKSCDFVYSPMFSCEDVDPDISRLLLSRISILLMIVS